MAGIYHQPLKVCVIHQHFQNPFPNSLIPPSTKPSVYILPVSIGFWQVPPRRSGAQNPKYSVDKLPGVSSIPASFPFSPIVYGSIFSQPLSLIPCRRYSFPIFQPSYFFEDYFIIFLLTIPSRPCLKNSPFLSAYNVVPSTRIALCCSGAFAFSVGYPTGPRCYGPPLLFRFRLPQI